MEQDIINVLDDLDKPAKSGIEINDALGFTKVDDYKVLERKLEEMTSKGILYYSEKKKRYLLLKNSHLMKGKLLVNPKGFGFVEIGEGKRKSEEIIEILKQENRQLAGKTAPACGLYLRNVFY